MGVSLILRAFLVEVLCTVIILFRRAEENKPPRGISQYEIKTGIYAKKE
jgi:hypothetical protein